MRGAHGRHRIVTVRQSLLTAAALEVADCHRQVGDCPLAALAVADCRLRLERLAALAVADCRLRLERLAALAVAGCRLRLETLAALVVAGCRLRLETLAAGVEDCHRRLATAGAVVDSLPPSTPF